MQPVQLLEKGLVEQNYIGKITVTENTNRKTRENRQMRKRRNSGKNHILIVLIDNQAIFTQIYSAKLKKLDGQTIRSIALPNMKSKLTYNCSSCSHIIMRSSQ